MIAPSPVFSSNSPFAPATRMAPSPVLSSSRPLTPSSRMAPSPVRATMSERRGTVTMSLALADMWKPKPLKDSLRGCLTSRLIRDPS